MKINSKNNSKSRSAVRRLGVVVMAVVVVGVSASAAWAAGEEGIGQVRSFVSKLTTYVTAIAAGVAVLFVAINGVRYTLSNGNPSRQMEAKNGIVSAAVGLAVALSAGVLVQLVVAALK